MALDLVTGYKGQNHVTAEQWADFNRGIYGDAAILPIGNKMQVEIQTVNQITVKDGTGVFDGRQVYIGYGESENIAIESGTQEMLRNDIVVIKYTKDETSGVESVAFEVVTGMPAESDPADPSYQDMDIRTGVFVSQKPFCRVRLNGVAIEGVDMLVEVKEFAEHVFNPPVANLTATEPGRALDATMGKQLKDDFDQLNSSLNSKATYIYLDDSTVTNNPIEVVKNRWADIPDGVYIADIMCGGRFCALVQRVNGGQYGVVYAIGYGIEQPAYGRCIGGSWS